jgi:hypothetical protein
MKKNKSASVYGERVPRSVAADLIRRKSPSLRPDIHMMQAAVQGQPEACAIRDAWRFNHPVRIVTGEEFEQIVERSSWAVFNG